MNKDKSEQIKKALEKVKVLANEIGAMYKAIKGLIKEDEPSEMLKVLMREYLSGPNRSIMYIGTQEENEFILFLDGFEVFKVTENGVEIILEKEKALEKLTHRLENKIDEALLVLKENDLI